MGAKPQARKISQEDFFERKFHFKCEEEAGASLSHNQISRNFCGLLWEFLRDKCCQPFASDMPVFSKAKQGIYLPDIVVVCGAPIVENCDIEILDKKTGEPKRQIKKALINPILIAEVWSDSNKDPEKEEKLENYKKIETLQHYLTIEQIRHETIYYYKNGRGEWENETKSEDHDEITLKLEAGDFTFQLSWVYEKVGE